MLIAGAHHAQSHKNAVGALTESSAATSARTPHTGLRRRAPVARVSVTQGSSLTRTVWQACEHGRVDLAYERLADRMHVVSLPLVTRFRGVDVREVALFSGAAGWGEWSPFLEYGPEEAARWLRAALEEFAAAVAALSSGDAAEGGDPALSPDRVGRRDVSVELEEVAS